MSSNDKELKKKLVNYRDKVLTARACVSLLRPDLNSRDKEKLAKRILRVTESEDHGLGITPEQAQEIVLGNMQCISKNCPMLIFAEPMSRELNTFFGEDR